ncbi:hypothetical protein C1645_813928 [Glomus cerebriforme]|uniref:BTB/POZ domain-containing protein n=1 Tax=Glomus cerebriforme TaxID=658196 RepID=A0A397TR53_9GLOM|nr:hypothetical protein C1645_813928 [Glomus cerebriforme]
MSRRFSIKVFGNKTKETKETKEVKETKVDYDVIIYVGERPDFKEFHSHSKILRNKSNYFKKVLSNKDIEKKDGKYVIKNPNITPQIFDVILKYISTGQVNITNKSETDILNIIIASDDLKLKRLVKLAENSLIERQNFLQNDPVGTLQMVYDQKSLHNIQEFCLRTICLEPNILFKSDMFINLPAPILEIILKRDDLNLNEIEIWENLIKWGLAQEKSLNDDVSKWNQENFTIFERILHKFIPFIRFYEISSEDYFNKVRLYEEVLPKELRGEILKIHMIPGYTPTLNPLQRCSVNSVLIDRSHIAIFANWIDRNEDEDKKYAGVIPYKFNLLYRASRDGNTTAAFHAKCDNNGATVVVAKIKNSEQIVGGYNPFCWDSSNKDKATIDSFIFSFTNRNSLQSAKVAYSYGNQYSIQCYSRYGPIFGGGSDLFCNYDNIWGSHDYINSYPTLNLPYSFNVSDYEVFQVIKK